MNSPTGRQQQHYVPVYHDMRRVGRQNWDDTLANNAEPARCNMAFDFASIELRMMRPLLGWRYYFRWLLPNTYLYRVVMRGK